MKAHKELFQLMVWLNTFPRFDITKPFPPLPRPRGRYIIRCAVEGKNRNWTSYEVSNDDVIAGLLELKAKIENKTP